MSSILKELYSQRVLPSYASTAVGNVFYKIESDTESYRHAGNYDFPYVEVLYVESETVLGPGLGMTYEIVTSRFNSTICSREEAIEFLRALRLKRNLEKVFNE